MKRYTPHQMKILMATSIFWAIPYFFKDGEVEPEPNTQPYNIYVDAKNGDNTNSGLFETVPVRTINQAGIVMRGLPSDRETRGVNIYMWGSTLDDPTTIYRDYNDLSTNVGAPLSTFIGMNNYRITKNPNVLNTNVPILDGGDYSETDSRRLTLKHAHRPVFLYLEGSNIRVDNLEITGVAGNAIRHRGNNSTFRWLHIHHTNGEAIDGSGNDNLYEYCLLSNIDENISQGQESDGVQLSNSERPVIRYCVAHTLSGTGFNFSGNVNRGLMYLNDAFLCGYPFGLDGAVPEKVTGIGYRVAGTEATPSTKNAAIGNRSWDNRQGFMMLDKGSSVIMYNSIFASVAQDFNITGDDKQLIANNISLGRKALAFFYHGPGTASSPMSYFPRQRGNNWENLIDDMRNTNNAVIEVGSNNYKTSSTTRPTPPYIVGFDGLYILPVEAKYANASAFDYGFGKHVGPTDAVIELLRTLTPQQIRDKVTLYTG